MRDFFSEEVEQPQEHDYFSHEVATQPQAKKESTFNFGEIAKPFLNVKSAISGTAPMESAQIAYEQAKKPALEGIKNPIANLLASVGIDIASGAGAEAGAGAIGKGLEGRAAGLVSKAEGLVPRLLPPEKGVIANQIEHGGEERYQKNLAPFIKKSKDYKDLAGKLRDSETELSNQRQDIYDKNPQIQDQQMFQPALNTVSNDLGVIPGSKVESMKKLIDEQVDFLNKLPNEKRLSTQFTQDRKQAFQKMAENIYGEATAPDEKIAQQMYRDFAKSNQNALENLSPEIKPLNEKIGSLIQGKKSAANLGEKASVGQVPSLLEKVLAGTPFVNSWFPLNEAKRLAMSALEKSRNVPGLSGKIESNMSKAGLYKEMGEPGIVTNLLKQLLTRRK